MTDITADDERELRQHAQKAVNDPLNAGSPVERRYRTILALLDRPRMPTPVDVSDAVMVKIADENHIPYANFRAMYRALYDHYNPPPAPKKVEMWAIKSARGEPGGVFLQKSDAERCLERASGSRIVRLVEASDDHQ